MVNRSDDRRRGPGRAGAARGPVAAWMLMAAVGGAGGLGPSGALARQPEEPRPAATPAEAGRPAAPVQPEPDPLAELELPPIGGDEPITLTAFTEPVELAALVEYAATTLGINVTVKGSLAGTVTFNAPVSIPKSKLLPLVDALLDQHGWTITLDPTGFYIVQQRSEVPVNFEGEMPTTKIIPTPNVRPSALRSAIGAQFGGAGVTPGVPEQPGSSATKGIAYVDELGVIVVTDSPRRLAAIETLVQKLMGEYLKSSFSRLELEFVAAPVARDRALALVGQSPQQSRFPFQEQQQQQPQLLGRSAAVDNLADRLTVDPQGNALIFRGAEAEIEQVRAILKVIDVPSTLEPKPYDVGSSAKEIANIARDRGLGEVTSITSDAERELQYQYQGYPQDFFRQQQPGATTGGPVMVVDEARGRIIYYGTARQHEALRALVATLGVEDERIVLQPYRLKNAKAEDVATLIQGLLTNTTPTGDSSLLPQGQGGTRAGNRFQPQPRPMQPDQPEVAGRPGEEGLSFTAGDETFVIADVANNQVIVKAPAKLQPQFRQLIDRIDLRRAQVYIECKIVAVNWTDEFRLAFETQLINAGGTGGVLNTNFGLSNFPTGTQLNQPKNVATGLAGLTAAIIKSDQVPIIITALQREVDSRILSSPQLLVDDNEEASIVSIDEQPTTTVSQGTSTTETGFGGYEEAGTNLTVTPHISEAGYIRLEYEAELSSFTGQATADLPPPRQTNTIKAASVTLPTDFTVVLGGLNLDSKNRTVVKVPLLGDIPIIGALFSDDNKNNRKTTLYVFLTPRILKDENFNDLKNLTRGPQYRSKLDPDIPEMKPSMMDVFRYGGEPLEVPVAPEPEPVQPLSADSGPGGRVRTRPEDEARREPPSEISPDDEPGREGGGR